MAEKTANAPEKAPAKGKKGGLKPDIATFAGLLLALLGIVGGLILEGGQIGDISQVTAALIVLGGTMGAVLVTVPLSVAMGAFRKIKYVLFDDTQEPEAVVEEIIGYATKARKNGIVSLESETDKISDPFLKKALDLAVDGVDLQELRKMMELEIAIFEHHEEAEAKVFEAAGGYAPTIGIIGAVMGLIQVMKHIEDTSAVGHGIAVAFVATVYGVGVANILFLPAANKLKARAQRLVQGKELILEGVIGIVEGLNPKLIRSKLDAYLHVGHKPSKKGAKKEGAQAPAGQAAEA